MMTFTFFWRSRYFFVALALTTLLPLPEVKAQDDLAEFLNAGEEDASKLMNAYLNPMIEGLSYGFNGGWFNTAKAHKTAGIDIGVSLNAVFIPSSKNYFNPNDLGLQTVTGFTSEAPNGLAPTLVGPSYDTHYESEIDVDGDGSPDQTLLFDGPPGIDMEDKIKISGTLAPMAQLGVGIIKNTDLKIRWMPEVNVSGTRIKLIGLGVMHDIKQHIPSIKLLPFDLSLLAAYTKIDGSSDISGAINRPPGDTGKQEAEYQMNAWIIEAIISKKLSFVTFYGGLGYNAIKTTTHILGNYDLVGDGSVVLTDPVSLKFKNNSMRLTGGMRLKMAIFYLSADYTLQEYSTVSVGLGMSFR